MDRPYDETLAHVRTCSRPSELKITDIRFAHITAASMHCILVKIYTNQGLVGMGEIRDGSSATYAAMLKSRLLGANRSPTQRDYQDYLARGGVCAVEWSENVREALPPDAITVTITRWPENDGWRSITIEGGEPL